MSAKKGVHDSCTPGEILPGQIDWAKLGIVNSAHWLSCIRADSRG